MSSDSDYWEWLPLSQRETRFIRRDTAISATQSRNYRNNHYETPHTDDENTPTEPRGLAVGTIDHEQYPDRVVDYRSLIGSVVSSLPALFVFENGDGVERMTGRKSKETLEKYRSAADHTTDSVS